MKAITLWQPWATLVAEGAKAIETRGWSTSYRGPLAIHAAKRRPQHDLLVGGFIVDAWLRDPTLIRMGGGPYVDPRLDLPLGAVVATATLVDVVPIVDAGRCRWDSAEPTDVEASAHAAIDGQVVVHTPVNRWSGYHTTLRCEEAYGDYTPGRFAWLLADVVALDEPVEARGRQQLWEWDAA